MIMNAKSFLNKNRFGWRFVTGFCSVVFFTMISLSCDLNGDLWGNASAPIDKVPPCVTGVTPSGRMDLSATVTIIFNEPLNEATVTQNNVYIYESANESVKIVLNDFNYNPGTGSSPTTLELVPSAVFSPSTNYTVLVKGSIEDVRGNSMGSDDSRSFTTIAKITDETVQPINIKTTSTFNLVYRFSEAIDDTTGTILVQYKETGATELNPSGITPTIAWNGLKTTMTVTLDFATSPSASSSYDLGIKLSGYTPANDRYILPDADYIYVINNQ